jgi:hypothetical protein
MHKTQYKHVTKCKIKKNFKREYRISNRSLGCVKFDSASTRNITFRSTYVECIDQRLLRVEITTMPKYSTINNEPLSIVRHIFHSTVFGDKLSNSVKISFTNLEACFILIFEFR